MTFKTPAIVSSFKAFAVLHPVGVMITGGALIGTGSYFLAKKLFSKDEVKQLPVATTE